VKDGRQGQLVERCRRGGATELTEKLLQHPVLSWVQASLSDDYEMAAKTLYSLALEEVELVTRKKVIFVIKNINFL
jgi:nuclear pore complex protein Nup133